MPKIQYREINFSPAKREVIDQANRIIAEYTAQGFDLTLRQLYYQFVSRDLIPNRQQEYKRLGDIVNDGRLAGLIDWDAITDRTRELRKLSHWDGPEDIVKACSEQFYIDRWAGQEKRVEVWIEKDALVGVIEGVCNDLDVPHFSCRGYTSQSEMWAAAQRLRRHEKNGQTVVLLHFGDHDPSGIDMSRDIEDRLNLFRAHPEFHRIALNRDQIDQYEPPPNPAKTTDSRYAGYIQEHGEESWELDALEPSVIADLVRGEIEKVLDQEAWREATEKQDAHREELEKVADRWDDVLEHLAS